MNKRQHYPSARLVFTDLRMCLAFGFGSGLSRKMPGTVGTIAALPCYLALSYAPIWVLISCIVVGAIAGVFICDYAAKKCGVDDHGGIVWDEFIGFWITMLWLPNSWPWVLAGFCIFRFFDIVKPWPIRWLDTHVHGGAGIMLDDIVAGIFSLACLHGFRYFVGL